MKSPTVIIATQYFIYQDIYLWGFSQNQVYRRILGPKYVTFYTITRQEPCYSPDRHRTYLCSKRPGYKVPGTRYLTLSTRSSFQLSLVNFEPIREAISTLFYLCVSYVCVCGPSAAILVFNKLCTRTYFRIHTLHISTFFLKGVRCVMCKDPSFN